MTTIIINSLNNITSLINMNNNIIVYIYIIIYIYIYLLSIAFCLLLPASPRPSLGYSLAKASGHVTALSQTPLTEVWVIGNMQ